MGFVSQALRDSAKGQQCTVRFPCCNHDPTTTVLAHLPSPVAGMTTKSDDFHAVFSCSSCHAVMDERPGMYYPQDEWLLPALQRTQKFWFDSGLITIGSDKETKVKRTSKSLPPRNLFGGK